MIGVADELKKLGQLKADGLLTDAEFETQKSKLLQDADEAQTPAPAEEGPVPSDAAPSDNTFQRFGLPLLVLFFVVGLAVGKTWNDGQEIPSDETTDWLKNKMAALKDPPPEPKKKSDPAPVAVVAPTVKPSPAPVVEPPAPAPVAKPAPSAPVAKPVAAPKAAPAAAKTDSVWKVPVFDADGQLGPKNAPATVVLFSNFENSACKSFAPNVRRLVKEYGKKVRVVFKHKVIPASADGILASEAALAAGAQGKFWEYHDKLMADPLVPNRAGLEAMAQGLGLKMGPFRKALDKNTYRLQALKDGLLSNTVAAHSMPNILVNGVRTTGDKSYEVMKALVDKQLATRPKGKTYDQLIAGGKSFEQLGPAVGGFDTANSPTLGKAGARVQVVVFEDFQ